MKCDQFWLEADDDTQKAFGCADGEDYLFARFKWRVGSMSLGRFDPSHERLEYVEGREVFDGEEQVFAHLTITLARQRYGWHVHHDRLRAQPPSSSTYADPGYNSSCGNVTFNTGNETNLPSTDQSMLTGKLDCAGTVDRDSGVVMSWILVPIF